MPGAKQNEIQNKLDSLNEVPQGFHFDSDAVWQKLAVQIKPKPRKAVFFWLSAAAIILIVAGSIILLNTNRHLGNTGISITSSPKLKSKESANLNQKNTVQNGPISPEKNIVSNTGKKPNSVLPKKVIEEVKPQEVEKDIVTDIKPDALSIPQTVAPNNVSTANVIKPKFKIAHINELYGGQTTPVLPAETKNNTVLSLKRNHETIMDEPTNPEERIITQKKSKTLFSSLVNLSQ